MKRAVEISTYDHQTYRVTEGEGEAITQAMAQGASHVSLTSEKAVIAVSNIARMDAVTVADYVAVSGELPPPLDLDAIKPRTEYQARWLRLLALNAARIKTKKLEEQLGLLKNLADLDAFERSRQWPEYMPVSEWGSQEGKKRTITYTYIKKRVTRREYERANYASQPNYWFVSEEEGDMGVARVYPRIRGRQVPDGFVECTESECDRLDYVRGVYVSAS